MDAPSIHTVYIHHPIGIPGRGYESPRRNSRAIHFAAKPVTFLLSLRLRDYPAALKVNVYHEAAR